MQSETQAAILAWLWSLACPVINRYPSAIWYRPDAHLLSWRSLLQRCDLPAMDTIVTNVEQAARDFGQRCALEGVPGVVYAPLTSSARYLISNERDWNGVSAMQRITPVCLTHPHGAGQLVCIVGQRVVWDGEPSTDSTALEQGLRRFAAEAGLLFVELALAPSSQGMCIIDVEPYPQVHRFGEAARRHIAEALVDLLTGTRDPCRASTAQAMEHASV